MNPKVVNRAFLSVFLYLGNPRRPAMAASITCLSLPPRYSGADL